MSVPKDMLVFISGSSIFVKGLAPMLGSHTRLAIALDSSNRVSGPLRRAYPSLRWTRLVHAELGGVTSAQNWFGAGVGIALGGIAKNPYRRSIGEVLHSTLKGQFGRARPIPAARSSVVVILERQPM
jgi:hypothetical protein